MKGHDTKNTRRSEGREAPEMDVAQVHGAILREKEEPKDGHEPIPLWLMTFFLIVAFWSGGYLCFYSGGFRGDVFSETQVVWGVLPPSASAKVDPIAQGRKLFIGNCAACHQVTGLGQPGVYPPLAGSEWVLGAPNRLVTIVLNGLQGPVHVKGLVFNGAMPTWAPVLKDAQLAAILTYVRQEWGNKAGPIAVEGVAALRAQQVSRAGKPMIEAELQALKPAELPSPAGIAPTPPAPAVVPAAAPTKKS